MNRVTDPFWVNLLGEQIDKLGRYRAVVWKTDWGRWAVTFNNNADCILDDFPTKKEALAWCKECDYAVVKEHLKDKRRAK